MRKEGWSYLLRLSRPRFWSYLAGPVLVGAAYGARDPRDLADARLWALFLFCLLPANLLLYGVNDLHDAGGDALNPKKDGRREARYRPGGAVLAALLLSALAALALLAVLPASGRPWLTGFLLLGWAYSAPPPRLKARPFWDSLSNGLYILPGAAAYQLLAGHPPPAAALVAGWLWTMAMHTFSAIPDIEPDRLAGIRTTATRLGTGGALAYCFLCWLGSALAMGSVAWPLGLPLAVYPALLAWLWARHRNLEQAYWWFPAINTAVGMILTLLGLAGLPRA